MRSTPKCAAKKSSIRRQPSSAASTRYAGPVDGEERVARSVVGVEFVVLAEAVQLCVERRHRLRAWGRCRRCRTGPTAGNSGSARVQGLVAWSWACPRAGLRRRTRRNSPPPHRLSSNTRPEPCAGRRSSARSRRSFRWRPRARAGARLLRRRRRPAARPAHRRRRGRRPRHHPDRLRAPRASTGSGRSSW